MEGDEPLWRPLKERGSSPTANRSAFDEATWLLSLSFAVLHSLFDGDLISAHICIRRLNEACVCVCVCASISTSFKEAAELCVC